MTVRATFPCFIRCSITQGTEIRILRVLSEMKLRVMTLTHRRSGVDRIWARLCDGDRLALT
jgi:hypothetical protein